MSLFRFQLINIRPKCNVVGYHRPTSVSTRVTREATFFMRSSTLAGAFMAVTRARMLRARSSRGLEAASRRSRRVSEVASMSSRSRSRRARAAESMSRRSGSGREGSRRRVSHSARASRTSAKVWSRSGC